MKEITHPMNNSKAKLLPPKLNLEMVAAELGLSNLSESSQLEALLQYQRDYGLILRTNSSLDCNAQRASHDTYEPADWDYTQSPSANEIVFRVTTQGQTITLGPAYLTSTSRITFEKFSIDEIDLYPVDDAEEYVGNITCDLTDIYVDKDDLVYFLNQERNKIPVYADPSSEYYAPELALAITLHNALRINKEGNPEQSTRDRVDLWLRKHHPEGSRSDAQTARLATIIGNGKKTP